MSIPQAQTIINAQVVRAVEQIRENGISNIPGPQGPPGTGVTKLKPKDITFLESKLPDAKCEDIVASGDSAIYKDMYAFTDRLSHMVSLHSEAEVKAVPHFAVNNAYLVVVVGDVDFLQCTSGHDVGLVQRAVDPSRRYRNTFHWIYLAMALYPAC